MRISIITPCRNSEKTIERTIKSVLQDIKKVDLEYIIVDGASTDGTLSIIKKYAEIYPRNIKYISEKDGSMTEALNKGLRMATGDIIASINADDEYLTNALVSVIEYIKKHNSKVLMVNTYYVIEDTGRVHSKGIPWIFNEKLCAVVECPFPECGIFFSRKCFDKVGLFNEQIKYTQDFEFYLRLLHDGYKFEHADIDASVFYRSDSNYSSTISRKMNEEVYSYYKYARLYRLFAQSIISKLVKMILGLRVYYFSKKNIEDFKNKK